MHHQEGLSSGNWYEQDKGKVNWLSVIGVLKCELLEIESPCKKLGQVNLYAVVLTIPLPNEGEVLQRGDGVVVPLHVRQDIWVHIGSGQFRNSLKSSNGQGDN